MHFLFIVLYRVRHIHDGTYNAIRGMPSTQSGGSGEAFAGAERRQQSFLARGSSVAGRPGSAHRLAGIQRGTQYQPSCESTRWLSKPPEPQMDSSAGGGRGKITSAQRLVAFPLPGPPLSCPYNGSKGFKNRRSALPAECARTALPLSKITGLVG